MSPNVYIIAGPNGAGKTTFATEFLPAYGNCKNFVNADLIAQGVSPFQPEAAAFRAGRMMLEQIEFFAARHIDFAAMPAVIARCEAGEIAILQKQAYARLTSCYANHR